MADLETVHATIDHSGITGVGGGADPSGFTAIVKSADQDVVNAQNTDDNDLQFAVTATKIYLVDIIAIYASDTAAADFEMRLAVSAGTMDGRGTMTFVNTADTSAVTNVAASAAATTSNLGAGLTASDLGWPVVMHILFPFRQNTTSGTFKVQFGNQNVGSGRTARLMKGSTLRYKQLN